MLKNSTFQRKMERKCTEQQVGGISKHINHVLDMTKRITDEKTVHFQHFILKLMSISIMCPWRCEISNLFLRIASSCRGTDCFASKVRPCSEKQQSMLQTLPGD